VSSERTGRLAPPKTRNRTFDVLINPDILTYYRHGDFVLRYNGQLLPELHMGLKPSGWLHLTTAEVDEYNLSSRIQLFMGPEYLAPIWRIHLAKNPSPIRWDEFYMSVYHYYERVNRTEYYGEAHTSRFTRSGVCTLHNCTPAIRPA